GGGATRGRAVSTGRATPHDRACSSEGSARSAGNMSGVVTASEAANIRAARDQAWVEHRGVLDESSADRFEDLLRQDDLATNACFMQVNELAELRQGLQAAAVISADINSAREALGRAKSDLERIEGEIAETV